MRLSKLERLSLSVAPHRVVEHGASRRRPSFSSRRRAFEFRDDLLDLKRSLHFSLDSITPSHEDLQERVLLIGVSNKSEKKSERESHAYSLEESLEELDSLAKTAGLRVVGCLQQKGMTPNPASYIGSGKLEEIVEAVKRDGVDSVVFDTELSPVQAMNIEKALGDKVRICDRTALTLDIFSQRALSKEGKLQVELAQCQYQLPRLTRLWTHLERQVGGTGSNQAVKGMGEKQIEIDKRLLRKRISALNRELEEVKLQRRLKRHHRAESDLPVVALVGYTNAGKSSLFNALTESDVFVEDKFFATLDPTTRRLKLPSGKMALISDTVGFIQRLPPRLIAAFEATLEELLDAALLIHVVDVTSPQRDKQQAAVTSILDAIGAHDLPVVTVWNKLDALPDEDRRTTREAAGKLKGTYCTSASKGMGLDVLLSAVEDVIESSMVPMKLSIPFHRGDLVQRVHDHGIVKECHYDEEGTRIEASIPIYLAAQLKPYAIKTVCVQSTCAN